MEDKEKFVAFLKDNTSDETEARIYFNLCSFIAEHGDGRVRSDFNRLREMGVISDEEAHITMRITEANRLLKQFQEEN